MSNEYWNARRRAHAEVCSLLSEGYRLVFEHRTPRTGSYYLYLQHVRNGHRAMVRVNGSGADLFIDGNKVKDI